MCCRLLRKESGIGDVGPAQHGEVATVRLGLVVQRHADEAGEAHDWSFSVGIVLVWPRMDRNAVHMPIPVRG